MKRVLITLSVAAALALAMLVVSVGVGPTSSLAKNTCTTTFEHGTTTTTCTKGSHGSETSHHGSPNSSGLFLGSTECKATGSTQTNTC